MHHCTTPSDCHSHEIQTVDGAASGSFPARDHQYSCWLEVRLTATDSGGLASTTSVRLDPRTVVLTFTTNPGGLKLAGSHVQQRGGAVDPVQRHGGGRLAELGGRPVSADLQPVDLLLLVVVGR
jgi:hypothetical protein